ncbi:hypothetical protein [Streptomyces vinaceus]|uniref:hypothetical protein n=1 Tax=Streptomyces vinaceus TaxID=1960 RepID=UPI0036C5A0B1
MEVIKSAEFGLPSWRRLGRRIRSPHPEVDVWIPAYEVSDAYIVMDTGVWIFGKEVLLPAGTILRVDGENKTVHLERTKEQIKAAPEFHRDNHLRDPDHRQEISKYYAG